MVPNDPRTCALIDRLTAMRMDTRQAILQTRLAIEATDRVLRQTRAVLALPAVTAEELEGETN